MEKNGSYTVEGRFEWREDRPERQRRVKTEGMGCTAMEATARASNPSRAGLRSLGVAEGKELEVLQVLATMEGFS
jgi:hypothetical protein